MPAYATTSSPQTEQDAVALICSDAGIATNAVYGSTATTALFSSISPAISGDFNYTAQLHSWASNYPTLDIWIDSLKSSMSRYQPVLYLSLIHI